MTKMYFIIVLCLVWLEAESTFLTRTNVCKNFKAYSNPRKDESCYYNPDLDSTPEEIAKRYGYILEDTKVTTEDGYILSVFRIRRKSSYSGESRQPVVLQHGILVDARSWFMSGRNSLAFHLVANGFDLWMPNFRGTKYSSAHSNYSISRKEYYDYSFHELGIYDVSAVMELVAKTTKREDIIYIGHSMGCTSFMVYASLKFDHAKKYTNRVIYLAPVAYPINLAPIISLILPFIDVIETVLKSLNIYSFGDLNTIQSFLTGLTCYSYPMNLLCHTAIALFAGKVEEQIRPELFPLMLKFYPVGISVKALLHYFQIMLAKGRFQQYDYGKIENMKKYQSVKPPVYEIGNITIPTYIFAGDSDLLSPVQDAYYLFRHINATKDIHTYTLAHVDFMFGKSVDNLYNDILDTMKKVIVTNSTK